MARRHLLHVLALTALTAVAPSQTRLELGKMWTFENPPLAYLQEEYGFAPNQEWLDGLRMASLRFGGWCSASFVSPRGLIMTNHHCARDNIAEVSPPGADWVKDGFYARSVEDEARLPGLTVQQLVSMRDVTTAMFEGVEDGMAAEAANERRDENEHRILAAAERDHPGLMAEVVRLHQGAAFHLYLYKVYDDIRLVCAPHLQTAHFGGDPDNFTYPRYSIDFAFCRAYEDGAPADTSAHYFRWSRTGAAPDELVFVTGNPGSTGRLLTVAQMEYLRDAEYPITLELLQNRLAVLQGFVERFPQLEPRLRTVMLGDENSIKATRGYFDGLLDTSLMATKRRLEQELRGAVAANQEWARRFGGCWDELARINAAKTELEAKLVFQVPSYSPHLSRAVAVVHVTDPATPAEERAAAQQLIDKIPVDLSPLQQALFIDHVQRAVHRLGREDPYVAALVGDEPAEMAAVRMATSRIGDADVLKALLEGGAEAVAASEDRAVVIARQLVPMMRANLAASDELLAREAIQERLVGQAMHAVYGDRISPDATMTLRFSDGVVRGYPYNGTVAPYRTTFFGLYGRSEEFDDRHPFDLPQAWLDARDRVAMAKAVNFVSTNDIIGGNSGSPVVNSDLEVVGLIFDGNIEQLANRFLFRSRSERSVSVHVDAIVEALTKIYDAQRVADELMPATGG